MRGTSMWTIGCVAMAAAVGMVNVSNGFAGEAGVERHGVGGAIYSTSQPMRDGAVCAQVNERRTVDAVERIGHGGSTYGSKAAEASDCQGERKSVDVVQRIGQGGSIYTSSQLMTN